ncbi:MAG: NAD regulator [Acidobacteria bacterium]|nr:NAD regulator [Acidobacteriota bacterium]
MPYALTVGLHAAILAVTGEEPRILTVPENESGRSAAALPFGPLEPARHRTLELGLLDWVREQTGMNLTYVEQLYTFGDRDRALLPDASTRVLAVAYLALVRERRVTEGHAASWQGIYRFLPWEDRRAGEPAILRDRIRPALADWVSSAREPKRRRQRRGRVDITFGAVAAPWDNERVLDRYELLYEAGLIAEAMRDCRPSAAAHSNSAFRELGSPLAFDHRRILATALGRLRGKLKYRPVVFELLPETFTLFQLQRTVESLVGVRLHKQNFRRLVGRGALVEATARFETATRGRPAELFRFRREVLHERSAPGVGLPSLPE